VRKTFVTILSLGALVLTIRLFSQSPSLTLLSKDGRRPMPLSVVGDQEFVALDDLASAFQLMVREESGAITVSYRNRTIVLTGEQPLASIEGRLISLPARPVRSGSRWLVPVEFINRALALVYDAPLDLHRPSRLLVIGNLRVPRVTIRHEPLGNAARLTIDATPRAASVVSQEGTHLTIRFEADALDVTPPPIQSQGFVLAVRLVDAVTLAVDLGPRFGGFRATSETIDTTTRLVIDFLQPPADSSAVPPAPPAPAELPDLHQPATGLGTLVLDPGHGGADKGAIGPGGLIEKDLTLTIARRLKAAVEARLGIRVILTRDSDQSMSLDDRAAVANNNKAGLFLSLHANAAPRPQVAGAAIYVAAFSDADLARAGLTPERVPLFGGGSRDIELVPWNVAQMRFTKQSTEAAHLVDVSLQAHLPLVARLVSSAPFRVLESANMPALLVEMGFLSNPEQEKQLGGNDFQSAFAQAIVDAVVGFRDARATADGAEP
jgi:N-acetylmuramoyl-L-alanine amidase